MELTDELVELETRFWTGDAAFYERELDDRCLVAFSPEMAGVMSKQDVAATVGDGPRWDKPKIDVKGCIQPTDDLAILTYAATSKKPGGKQYKALVSSGYVKRDGGWKLAFHQQMPL